MMACLATMCQIDLSTMISCKCPVLQVVRLFYAVNEADAASQISLPETARSKQTLSLYMSAAKHSHKSSSHYASMAACRWAR